MTRNQKVTRRNFAKAILAGKTQKDAAIEAGFSPERARVTGSELMRDPEVQKTLESSLRNIRADEDFLARKLKEGADRKPGGLQLEYLDRISDYLGHGRKQDAPANFNILSIISGGGLVDAKGRTVDPAKLVNPE